MILNQRHFEPKEIWKQAENSNESLKKESSTGNEMEQIFPIFKGFYFLNQYDSKVHKIPTEKVLEPLKVINY